MILNPLNIQQSHHQLKFNEFFDSSIFRIFEASKFEFKNFLQTLQGLATQFKYWLGLSLS